MFDILLDLAGGFWGAFPLLVVLPACIYIVRSYRRRRWISVLAYVRQAVRLRLPMAETLEAAAWSEKSKLGGRLTDLHRLTLSGLPLSAALALAVPETPLRVVNLIGAGERLGRLGDALGRIRDVDARQTSGEIADRVFRRIYPVAVCFMVLVVMNVLMIFVVPKMEQIFKDFGIKLPPVSQWTIDLARRVGPWLILPVVGVVLFNVLALFKNFSGTTLAIWRRWIDPLTWCLPILHGLARDRGLADTADIVADALDARRTLVGGLDEVLLIDMNAVLYHRIRKWQAGLERGEETGAAARSAGLPSLFAGLAATAPSSTDPADVYRFLSRFYRDRVSRWQYVMEAALVPATALLLGLVVAAVCLSFFQPMVDLMMAVETHSRRVG